MQYVSTCDSGVVGGAEQQQQKLVFPSALKQEAVGIFNEPSSSGHRVATESLNALLGSPSLLELSPSLSPSAFALDDAYSSEGCVPGSLSDLESDSPMLRSSTEAPLAKRRRCDYDESPEAVSDWNIAALRVLADRFHDIPEASAAAAVPYVEDVWQSIQALERQLYSGPSANDAGHGNPGDFPPALDMMQQSSSLAGNGSISPSPEQSVPAVTIAHAQTQLLSTSNTALAEAAMRSRRQAASFSEQDVKINLHTSEGGTKLINDVVVYRSGRDRCPLRPQVVLSDTLAKCVLNVACCVINDSSGEVVPDVIVDATGLPRTRREDPDLPLSKASSANGHPLGENAFVFNLLLLTTCRKSRCQLFRLRFAITYQDPDTGAEAVFEMLSRQFKAVSGNVGPKNLSMLREQLGGPPRSATSSPTPTPPSSARGVKRSRSSR